MKKNIIKTYLTVTLLASSVFGCVRNQDTYFKVTFKNYDDTILYQTRVKKGGTAIYDKDTPTRPATFDYYYEFLAWDKDLTNVTENLEVKATYNEKSNHKELVVDYNFEIIEHAERPDENTTNYLGHGKSGKLYLNEPVTIEGEQVEYQSINFDDMEFDYAVVDFNTVGEYPFTITYDKLSVADYLDVVPDVSKWTYKRTYTGSATQNVNGPEWWKMEYIDFYNEGVVINNDQNNAYLSEDLHDGKSVRFHRIFDGASVDVIYDYYQEGLDLYSFPDHPDVVATLEFVADNPPQTIDPTSFTLSIHQSLEEAPSAYGLVEDDDANRLTVKYDYDLENNSIKLHLKGYPKPFVYNEDGKYHYY